MPLRLLSFIAAAGAFSAGLFLAVVAMNLGFFFMFVSTLPLFTLGMSRDPKLALYAALAATLAVGGITGLLDVSLIYLLFLGLPSWFLSRQALLFQDTSAGKQWFPIGLIFVKLTVYAVAALALISLYYAASEESMPARLARTIHENITDIPPEFADIVGALATQWSFLVFSMMVWLWGIALYVHGWVANRLLRQRRKNIRPGFALKPFLVPNWMLGLIAICALAAIIGGESVSFLGKSSLISLMLPYFFAGLAIMHEASKTWPTRRLLLFFVYSSLVIQFWPVFVLAGIGLWAHIKHLLATAGSSKN